MPMIEFHTGQSVSLPLAPDGFGQIEEIRRSNLSVLYCRGGKLCRVINAGSTLARMQHHQPLMPLPDNWMRRGIGRVKRKVFRVESLPGQAVAE